MEFQAIRPIQPLWTTEGAEAAPEAGADRQSTLFSDIFQAAIDNVRETEAAKNDAEYRLTTGQIDNPAEVSIASSQWTASVELLIQLRSRALDAYSEIMRMSL